MVIPYINCRRAIKIAVVATAALLSACANWTPLRGSMRNEVATTFATVLTRGLPSAVGVYGVRPHTETAERAAERSRRRVTRLAPREDKADWLEAAKVAQIGAGFFISADGLIVTAAHVVEDARQIVVSLPDQRVVQAELVAADSDTDVALLRVDASLPNAPPLGSSAGLRAGDWVLAIGEPYGLDHAAVAGIVGGPGRHFAEDAEQLYIQSDLSLNPGNSGGPLLDMRGNIVAMNLRTVVGTYGSAGLSLSLPIEIVQQIVAELSGRSRTVRPRLGALFEDVSPLVAFAVGRTHSTGALVSSVSNASLAQRMGLREADIVVGMNGWPIGDSSDLVRALLAWSEEDRARITVYRDGHYVHLRLPH